VTVRVVLASRNKSKVEEVRRILEPLLDVEFVPAPDLDVAETGATFLDNAKLKATAYAQAAGLPAFADDSGLCVDALNGMPVVLSARWAGRHGDDVANLQLVLDQVADIPDERRGAAFVCVAAFALPDGNRCRCCPGAGRGDADTRARAAPTALATTRSSCRTERRARQPSYRLTRKTRSVIAVAHSAHGSAALIRGWGQIRSGCWRKYSMVRFKPSSSATTAPSRARNAPT